MEWNRINFPIRPWMSKVAGWWAGLPLAVVLCLFLFLLLFLLLFLITIFLHKTVNGFTRAVLHESFVQPP